MTSRLWNVARVVVPVLFTVLTWILPAVGMNPSFTVPPAWQVTLSAYPYERPACSQVLQKPTVNLTLDERRNLTQGVLDTVIPLLDNGTGLITGVYSPPQRSCSRANTCSRLELFVGRQRSHALCPDMDRSGESKLGPTTASTFKHQCTVKPELVDFVSVLPVLRYMFIYHWLTAQGECQLSPFQ